MPKNRFQETIFTIMISLVMDLPCKVANLLGF